MGLTSKIGVEIASIAVGFQSLHYLQERNQNEFSPLNNYFRSHVLPYDPTSTKKDEVTESFDRVGQSRR